MGQNGNKNSLANLKSWKPGQSGNPSGRPRGMVYPSELLAGLLAMNDDGTPKYTKSDIQAIVDSDDSAPAIVIAAQWILQAMMDGKRYVLDKDGNPKLSTLDPTPSRVRVELADRQEGKPTQKIEMMHTEHIDPIECLEKFKQTLLKDDLIANPSAWPYLLTMLKEHPSIVESLRPMLEEKASGLLALLDGPIDVEARVLTAADEGSSAIS